MFDFGDNEPALPGAGSTPDEEVEDDDTVIMVDAWRTPRGRCGSCSSCRLWTKASGPFAHLHCGTCKCKTTAHEDLSSWLREVLEHSTPTVESLLVSKGIPLKAYTCWSPLETLFHLETDGAFSPLRDGRNPSKSPREEEASASLTFEKPLCSVICPTTAERHAFHPLLYHCFCQQSYQPRELVVIDTGPRPSSFLVERAKHDRAVVYRWFTDGRWTIGTKRNLACFLSRGELIAHFDDDDLYAPDYLAHMNQVILAAAGLGQQPPEADVGDGEAGGEGQSLLGDFKAATTLSSWHVFDTTERTFRFLHAVSDKWVYGWGFSFVFTREAWRRNFFPYRDIGEDFDFMMALRKLPGAWVLAVEDPGAICSHTYHPKLSISGGEKRRDGTHIPIGQEVQPPEPLARLLPLLFEADGRALRNLKGRPMPSEDVYSYSVSGSWNGWSSFEELHRNGTGRLFSATILMPSTPLDVEFQVFANRDYSMSYHPSATGLILGPWRCPGANWKVQVSKSRNAISVSWDPSGEKKLVVQAVARSSLGTKPTASASRTAPMRSGPALLQPSPSQPAPAKSKKEVPTLTCSEALDMQDALIGAYKTEDFQEKLRRIWSQTGGDRVLRYKLRQDLCLPIQGPIVARFGFEPSRLGVAQCVALFKSAAWCQDPTVVANNNLMHILCDIDAQMRSF
uniref:Glycosyltransferase 2-like domain-containing protein n=1 Tax=Alexandrium monilatum TaxID=311494 RepID=A0A6T1E7A2_9DINO|mmetsp:Transcript_15608/g.46784  ORF Transcript_15608/g.46784 Transcript_15608/m.46784 type:complete len:681 (-) Transcript_15608:351-2393(-)